MKKLIISAVIIIFAVLSLIYFVRRPSVSPSSGSADNPASEASSGETSGTSSPVDTVKKPSGTSNPVDMVKKPSGASLQKPAPVVSPLFQSSVFKNATMSSDDTIPTIITKLIPEARVGNDYGIFITAGGGGKKYYWGLVAGKLPQGIKSSPTTNCDLIKIGECRPSFEISGIPTLSGSFGFRVAVSDGTKAIYKDFVLIVQKSAVLKITTESLPEAKVGESYSADINAVGGLASYSWSIINGSLPPGLDLIPSQCVGNLCQLSGKIVGRPGGTGIYKFNVTVSSGSDSVAKEFMMEVKL